jgi:hypothetical protein
MDTRRAVTAAICLALTAVLTGLALWIPAIDLPLARSVGFANVTTAAAAVTGLFTLIQFSTGGAVEGLISRILTPILEAIRSLREDLAATREATAANTAALVAHSEANVAALNRIDESLRWLASQVEANTAKVGDLHAATGDTSDTMGLMGETVARVGDVLDATQQAIVDGFSQVGDRITEALNTRMDEVWLAGANGQKPVADITAIRGLTRPRGGQIS